MRVFVEGDRQKIVKLLLTNNFLYTIIDINNKIHCQKSDEETSPTRMADFFQNRLLPMCIIKPSFLRLQTDGRLFQMATPTSLFHFKIENEFIVPYQYYIVSQEGVKSIHTDMEIQYNASIEDDLFTVRDISLNSF